MRLGSTRHGAAALALASVAASAWAERGPYHGLLGVGVGGGGGSLAEIVLTDDSRRALRTGSGYLLFGGVARQLGDTRWSAQLTLGVQSGSLQVSNGELRFTRFPLELLAGWELAAHWQLSAGLRKGLRGRLSRFEDLSTVPDAPVHSTAGAVLQLEYRFSGPTSLYLRGVQETWRLNGVAVTGPQVGAGVVFRF